MEFDPNLHRAQLLQQQLARIRQIHSHDIRVRSSVAILAPFASILIIFQIRNGRSPASFTDMNPVKI
jgi:hypothetical protein